MVLCGSVAFYEHINVLAAELEKLGFKAVVPETAAKMAKTKDYRVESVKTWYQNPEDFKEKARLMSEHFKEISEGNLLLIVNDEKHGQPGYIGSNVLLEMGIGFYLKKPIYLLNEVNKEAQNYEEVAGMAPIIINGNLTKISKE